ncbi:universal stress protein [Kribbella sancticallisti]|uniref:universal stress protein n=1 Tax=Kribbella sancticallisti TaxID=460087 RepID=UPI0031E214C0
MGKQIVVGVDVAWRRSGALDWALHEAALRQMPLHAVHVVDERPGYAFPLSGDSQVAVALAIPEPDSGFIDELEQYVVAAGQTLEFGTDVLVGSPHRRLVELSSEAALTVAGRRGAGGFDRLLIGSTSEFVANHAEGPVVVVPDGWRPDRATEAPIVVGVDLGEQHDAALEFAFDTAALHHVPLWMVHAWDAQLIVLGGHRGKSGLMIGSVARGVLQYAGVPVAVVHERGASS